MTTLFCEAILKHPFAMKAAILFFWLLSLTHAFAIRYEFGQNVTISQPVNGDLYVVGGTITINAPIRGDLIALGGTVTVNDSVTSDLLLAGGTVILNGYVGDDIRCAGGSIQLLSRITGDAVLAAGTLTMDRAGTIGGALLSASGTTTLSGQVGQEARLAFGNLRFDGTIAGDLTGRGGDATLNGHTGGRSVLAANELVIGPNARFRRDVRYWSRNGSVAFGNSVPSGRARFDASLAPDSAQGSTWFTWLGVLWYLGMAVLMIFLLQSLLSKPMKEAGKMAATNSLQSVGAGFLFFITVPIATIVAYASFIGIPVGILLTFGALTALLLAPFLTAVVLANMLQYRLSNRPSSTSRLILMALGTFVILQLMWMLPLIGWLLIVLFTSLAFGAILLTIQWRGRETARINVAQPQPTLS